MDGSAAMVAAVCEVFRKAAQLDLNKEAKELTTTGRKHIKTKNFALPAKARSPKSKARSGNYPIPDRAHARNALARVSRFGTPEEKARVRAKVHAKYPTLGKKSAAYALGLLLSQN